MWHDIEGALAIVAMVIAGIVVIPSAPKLVDALADRIRYGVQTSPDTADAEQISEMPAARPATERISKTATSSACATKAEPATTKATARTPAAA